MYLILDAGYEDYGLRFLNNESSFQKINISEGLKSQIVNWFTSYNNL
ncbi:MAG: hypothetical protein RL632_2283, partial [Bacteroidota bacterium]